MCARSDGLRRIASIAACATVAVAAGVLSHARPAVTIQVWKVGSPYKGEIPPSNIPPALAQASAKRGISIAVEAFPAKGFASMFVDAVTRNAAPDILVFDNMGVMNGITIGRETFTGIAEDSTIRRDLIRVTGALDELLGPTRGWTYLFSSSPNHGAARTLALRTPECPKGLTGPKLQPDLMELVPKLATAYLEGDAIGVQTYSDPERLATSGFRHETVSVGSVRPCGMWGNAKLAFAWVNASYAAETTIGHTPVVMVFRKPSPPWQLLVAARDPISTNAFIRQAPSVTALLEKDGQMHAVSGPATLLSPPDGQFPLPRPGERFGIFSWRSSLSDDVVAEIAEFAYQNDARLFLLRPPYAESRGQVSAGSLWTTRNVWNWRIWSVTRAGDVVFSAARTFAH